MNDQEIHDLKKALEFVRACNEIVETVNPLDEANVRHLRYMLSDADERLSRTLKT